MTPKEQRNERLAERMIKNLKRRNMEAFYCPTAEEAVKKVLKDGYRTVDIMSPGMTRVGTSEMGDRIVERL